MKSTKFTIAGFFGFLVVTIFNISMGVVIYSKIEKFPTWQIAVIILLFVIFSTIVCMIGDIIRRKVMIEKPLNEILKATKELSRGNFDIKLYPKFKDEALNEFDIIKDNINKMALELSKSEMLKNDFIANVSHEIKTPLSVIMTYAKSLENPSLDDDTKSKYLKNLHLACDRLNTLITNILKLNKLENQKLMPVIEKFNLSELVSSRLIQYLDLIEKKEIELNCDIEEDLFITSSESYIEIILNNLISNAVKFTETHGEIYVSLKKQNKEFIIKVQDTGCGMDKETGIHIFDKFYQGDTSRSSEGNGLGLALVKKVIDVLGGSISVESEKFVGSTFTVVLKEV